MRLYFTLTSGLIEFRDKPNRFAYQLAEADEALVLVNHWQNVLGVERIGEALLHRLIAEHIRGVPPRHYAEQLGTFDGGLRIEAGPDTLDFQCCGDLGDWAEWEQLLLEAPADWQAVWIGHPWVFVRFDEDWAYVSDYHDHTPAPADIKPRLVLPREDFAAGLRAAIAGLHAFFYQLRRVVLAKPAYLHKPALLAALTDGYFPLDEDDDKPLGYVPDGPLAPSRRAAGPVEP